MTRRTSLTLSFSLALGGLGAFAAPAAAQAVRIVDLPGVGALPTLQEAIDLAPEGSVLMVSPGHYSSAVIDGKSLSIVAGPIPEGWIPPRVFGSLEVRDLGIGQAVLISGITFLANEGPGVRLVHDHGSVRLVDCELEGDFERVGDDWLAAPGVDVIDSSKVMLIGCRCRGADAGFVLGKDPIAGGDGLRVENSAVALYDCLLSGGDGSHESFPSGGDGGHGARVGGLGIFVSGSTLRGGDGGDGDFFECTTGGDGGVGLAITDGQAQLQEATLEGGQGGQGSCGVHGAPGAPLESGGATVVQQPGPARSTSVDVLSSAARSLAVQVSGEPGDQVALFVASTPAYLFVPSLHGIWALVPAQLAAGQPRGVVPASGSLELQVKLPDLPAGEPHATFIVQALVRSIGGDTFLSAPTHTVALDRNAPPDCDGSATSDFVELIEGAPDCDSDLALDVCEIAHGLETDCDRNGVPDVCDLGGGAQDDCDDDGIPDACQLAAGTAFDCNANRRLDECDIASGTSDDVDGNGVPDECQPSGTSTIWVDAAAPAGGGGSRSAPFRTIREAILVSFHGDTVVIRDGIYTGPQNRDLDLGGRDIVVRSERGPSACIVDCQGLGRAFMMLDGETRACVLEGLTLRNGEASGHPVHPSLGGGILIRDSSPRIVDCVIETCRGRIGGGIYAWRSGLEVRGCIVRDCVAPPVPGYSSTGGGMYINLPLVAPGPAAIVDTEISGCSADTGGAITHWSIEPLIISHCRIVDNLATASGGGVRSSGVSGPPGPRLLMDDTLVAGNRATTGGGLALSFSSTSYEVATWRFSACTIVGNDATGEGGAISANLASWNPAHIELHGSIAWGNTASAGSTLYQAIGVIEAHVVACDIEGGQASFALEPGSLLHWGPGNLDLDPLFVDPIGIDPILAGDDDYRLLPDSPCLDAGDNTLLPPDQADIDADGDTAELCPLDLAHGLRRVDDPAPDSGRGTAPIVDIGALERQ